MANASCMNNHGARWTESLLRGYSVTATSCTGLLMLGHGPTLRCRHHAQHHAAPRHGGSRCSRRRRWCRSCKCELGSASGDAQAPCPLLKQRGACQAECPVPGRPGTTPSSRYGCDRAAPARPPRSEARVLRCAAKTSASCLQEGRRQVAPPECACPSETSRGEVPRGTSPREAGIPHEEGIRGGHVGHGLRERWEGHEDRAGRACREGL